MGNGMSTSATFERTRLRRTTHIIPTDNTRAILTTPPGQTKQIRSQQAICCDGSLCTPNTAAVDVFYTALREADDQWTRHVSNAEQHRENDIFYAQQDYLRAHSDAEDNYDRVEETARDTAATCNKGIKAQCGGVIAEAQCGNKALQSHDHDSANHLVEEASSVRIAALQQSGLLFETATEIADDTFWTHIDIAREAYAEAITKAKGHLNKVNLDVTQELAPFSIATREELASALRCTLPRRKPNTLPPGHR